MNKHAKFIYVPLGLAFFAMLFLWLRENEARTVAEEKLRDYQYKVNALSDEKSNILMDSEGRLAELEARLAAEAKHHEELLAVRDLRIRELEGQVGEAVARYDEAAARHDTEIQGKNAELEGAEKRSREESQKQAAALKDKNGEISDLGARLEDTQTRLSAALKKIQALEAQGLDAEDKLAELEGRLRKAARENADLSRALADAESQKPKDAILD